MERNQEKETQIQEIMLALHMEIERKKITG